ncbi:translation initiation factor eIF-2B subunit delta [Ostrinia furnacalis]|uniref:translation initiation factor eIF-2B subunit delta n=1 Tax=Ostrinia furnacalis TaxID=93504 RepID=UPI00103F35FC|nr:translation initiation factor eIF-2B subunit delta [Ostrinia furnacalis]
MVFSETRIVNNPARKRRLRRIRSKIKAASKKLNKSVDSSHLESTNLDPQQQLLNGIKSKPQELEIEKTSCSKSDSTKENTGNMSSKEDAKSREDVIAAREAKKLAKQKGKPKPAQATATKQPEAQKSEIKKDIKENSTDKLVKGNKDAPTKSPESQKSKDEVDKAVIQVKTDDISKEDIKAERAAKKAAKQAKKKKEDGGDAADDMTVKDVVETLKDIVNVAKEVQDVTAKVQAIHLEPRKSEESGKNKAEESGKSKAELRAERRAKQEAQRAAKQAAVQEKAPPKPEPKAKAEETGKSKEEKTPKVKSAEKSKSKQQSLNRVNWFQHLHMQQDKESMKKIPINSNLHPAIIKLGVQLASRVVSGSNARCIALLDALKKMIMDYTLPAKTEFARGLEAHLAASLDFLWTMRQPSASQANAVKFTRHHLTQLPNNVAEFDAKKILTEEIDRYIREQIDMAGEAISLTVRNKISEGDNILTYGCSSLIERILCEAWASGVRFKAIVVGARVGPAARARDMLRRLVAKNVPAAYADITAVSYVMPTINKVLLGASALLVNGSVLGSLGTAQIALAAASYNVPALVACETHKFSERVHTDAFVYNEIGDPDELIDKTDENSPLKDWRSNPNLTPLNLTYDVTPPSLITAVVTELAILPCTSAPVVLRFKLSEYGI